MNSSTDMAPDQLDALAETLDTEASAMLADGRMLVKQANDKSQLAGSLRRESQRRREGNVAPTLFVRPEPVKVAERPDIIVNGNGSASVPGTGEAIIMVLEAKGTPLDGNEVYNALDERGWLPQKATNPRAAVKASLWTLGKNNRIESLGDSPKARKWAAKTSSPKTHGSE
jgi:hypothetical protein